MNDIRDRLQLLIKTLGYTQKQFARVLGVQSPAVSRWLKPNTPPGANSCLRISSTIGCNLKWLETGVGEMFPLKGKELSKLEYAQIGLKLLSGENWQNALAPPPPETAEPKRNTEYKETATHNEFKKLCAANFDYIFDYISEEYGTEAIDIQMFIDDLLEVHHPFRVWLHEKKLLRKNNKIGGRENIA